MSRYEEYNVTLESDVEDFTNDYFDSFLGEVSVGNNDFDDFVNHDGKLIESIDQYIDLKDAVEIIERCENEETDSGLWEGLAPREAIIAMALWSYRNDFYFAIKDEWYSKVDDLILDKEVYVEDLESEIEELEEEIEMINGEDEVDDLEEKIQDLEDEIEELNNFISELSEALENLE